MSLFQCQFCGCCENTALSGQGCNGFAEGFYDWTGFEDRKGKQLCSACAPTRFEDGTPTEFGAWHGEFERVFLPPGMFRTARDGNLEHIETGDTDFRRYALPSSAPHETLESWPTSINDAYWQCVCCQSATNSQHALSCAVCGAPYQ